MTTGASPRRDVERNHEAIVGAAIDVLAASPDATLGEIARASGLGRSTLYRHFPDRDALVTAIVDRLLEESDALIAGHVAGAGDRSVLDTLVVVAEALAELGDRYGFLEAGLARRRAQQSTGRAGRVKRLSSLVTAGQADGTVRSDLTAEWLTAMLGHAVSEAADPHRPYVKERRASLAPTIRSLMAPVTAG